GWVLDVAVPGVGVCAAVNGGALVDGATLEAAVVSLLVEPADGVELAVVAPPSVTDFSAPQPTPETAAVAATDLRNCLRPVLAIVHHCGIVNFRLHVWQAVRRSLINGRSGETTRPSYAG